MKKLAILLSSTFLLILLLTGPPPRAEEADARDEDPKVGDVDKKKAKELLKKLEEAKKTKDVNKIVAALEDLVTARNEKFVKPLEKLAHHRSPSVRVMAVRALGSQGPAKKVGPTLFKIVRDKTKENRQSRQVIAMAISSLRRVRFDNKIVFDELKGLFRKRPSETIMKECVRYFGDLKKKEAVKLLIAWIEAPQPANPNSPTNPPASHWKRMWEIWSAIKDPVLTALKNITGKDYDTKTQWETWVRSREAKKMGIR